MQGLSRTRVPFGRLGSTPNKLKVYIAEILYNLYVYQISKFFYSKLFSFFNVLFDYR